MHNIMLSFYKNSNETYLVEIQILIDIISIKSMIK